MSVSCPERSFVSLGLSCQVSHQLRKQLVSDDPLVEESRVDTLYFDFITTPFDFLLRAIEVDIPDLTDAADIEPHLGAPLWKRHGVYFGHNFRQGMSGPIDVAGKFGRCSYMIACLKKAFQALDRADRDLLFFVGNAQPDLLHYSQGPAAFPPLFGFTRTRIERCLAALRGRYGSRFRGLVVVEGDQSNATEWSIDGVSRYHSGDLRGVGTGAWQGNDAFWRNLLRTELARVPVGDLTVQRRA